MKAKLLIIAGLLVVAAAVGFWERPVSYFHEATYLREFLTGVQSRSVLVAGHRVHYLAEGPAAGPAVQSGMRRFALGRDGHRAVQGVATCIRCPLDLSRAR